MSASITSRARIARRKAHRLELRLSQRGGTYRLTDDHGVTHELGPLAVIETYLAGHYTPRPPGPQPTVKPPPGWGVILEDYLLTLAAAGQRDATLRLRRYLLIQMAYGLGQPPESVTGELLVAWFGSQAHWALETRRSHRAAARCLFTWAYRTGKVPTYLADELPKVRQPKAPPRRAPTRPGQPR